MMELVDAIQKFKSDLVAVKADGKSNIAIENLEKYLEFLLADASQSLEHRKMIHQSQLAEYSATIAMGVESFRAVMDAGKEAINAAIIINGGAVIALMAFVGNSAAKYGHQIVAFAAIPLLLFGIGVFCGGVAFGTRYVSQFLYARPQNKNLVRLGHVFNGVSWIVTTGSFIIFAIGVFVGYLGLMRF
jgi:hypothetical protein